MIELQLQVETVNIPEKSILKKCPMIPIGLLWLEEVSPTDEYMVSVVWWFVQLSGNNSVVAQRWIVKYSVDETENLNLFYEKLYTVANMPFQSQQIDGLREYNTQKLKEREDEVLNFIRLNYRTLK